MCKKFGFYETKKYNDNPLKCAYFMKRDLLSNSF